MNAKTHNFSFKIECHRVVEVVSCIFHTILFLRSQGKLKCRGIDFSQAPHYYEDVDISFLDLTYVRSQSVELMKSVDDSIMKFCRELHNCSEPKMGKISLEFYRMERNALPFIPRHAVWEVWTIDVKVVDLMSVRMIMLNNIRLSEQLSDAIFHISEIINLDSNYVPKLSHLNELDLIFDLSFEDVQPYLFKISHQTKLSEISMVKAVKRFFDALF